MSKWSFIIDIAKCEDCNNCFLACKDEHVANTWPGYTLPQPIHGHRWINIMRRERGQYPLIDVAYRPTPCMHCDQAPCIRNAKDGEVYKREDGIVMIDYSKAAGRRELVKACPYGAIWWNEEANAPQKCTFCAHLLDQGWKKPRCAQACPTGALQAVKLDDESLREIIAAEGLEQLHPEYGTSPRVFYKNLHRFEKCFLGGSVAYENQGVIDCADGAEVTLYQGAKVVSTIQANRFGDFKFDGLAENSVEYRLEIKFRDFAAKVVEARLDNSLNLGTIML